ncbi:serine/threonine-protein phosphatase PP1, putative [Leishmania tarentolae]|uniref:Serine/threonine-protein phosphatase PP1, putative n=1 Tax=Leishmania tarentolae TaxID=5689 RepID=A0A640KRL1_LEITA|nr:serine/threonine-protein phosphatase PP1, putative [Leishmania tarentolae]
MGSGHNQEGALQFVVDGHYGSVVVKFAAVVRCREHGHKLTAREELVATLYNLMCAHNQIHVHHVQEVVHNVLTEQVAHAAVALQETTNFILRVRPQQIAQDAAIRHLARTLDVHNGRYRGQVRAKATMHADDLLANHAAHRHRVEHIRERLEQLDVIPPLHIIKKAVHLVDASTLVVTAQQKEVLRVHNLVAKLQDDRLHTVLAAVNVVAEEQVVRVWGETALLIDAQQVVVLPMCVTAHTHRRADLEQHWL